MNERHDQLLEFIREQAELELRSEEFRARVEEEKTRLRKRRAIKRRLLSLLKPWRLL